MGMIDSMRLAIEQAEKLGTPRREYRLHPDDYKALRGQCEPRLQINAAPWAPGQFAGVRIVEDEKAERLPRLKPPNARLSGAGTASA
jgi:hypothetical protein